MKLPAALTVALPMLAWMPTLQAMQVTRLETAFHEGEYQLTMTAVLAAPLEPVQAVLRDYVRYPQLDKRILESHIMSRTTPDQLQLMTRIRVCFAFLCRTVRRVEQVVEHDHTLTAQVLPGESNALRGQTFTRLSVDAANPAHTQLSYETRFVPGFWVPPWVGRAGLLRSMQEATVNLFTGIEQRASQPLTTIPIVAPATVSDP